MIWYWLIKAVRGFVILFGKPRAEHIAHIDPNAKCPICAWEKGQLKAVTGVGAGVKKVYCLHICKVCGARWFEKPVVDTQNVVPAAVAEFDLTWLESAVHTPEVKKA